MNSDKGDLKSKKSDLKNGKDDLQIEKGCSKNEKGDVKGKKGDVKGEKGDLEGNTGPMKLMFMDIKKAPLNGKVCDDKYEYISLPEEAESCDCGGGCIACGRQPALGKTTPRT